MSVTRVTASSLAALFTVAVAAGASQSAQPTSPSADYLLMTGRAGRIELGMSVDEVYQLFGRDNVSLVAEFREGMFSPVLKVRIPGATAIPAISIDIREWPAESFRCGVSRSASHAFARGMGLASAQQPAISGAHISSK